MSQKLYHKIELVIFLGVFITWTTFIWHNSFEPANVSGTRSLYITDVINGILAPTHIQLTDHIVRKTAHFAEYAISGALMFFITLNLNSLLQKEPTKEPTNEQTKKPIRKSDALVILIGFMIAFVDEMIQRYTPGRSCQFSDMMLDTIGFACGFSVLKILRSLYHLIAKSHRPS